MCARISTYSPDLDVKGNDRWIGSDWQTPDKLTKNFTANAVADYYNRTAKINTGAFAWTYKMYSATGTQPDKTFELIDHPFDTVDIIALEGVIRVSFMTLANTQPGGFIEDQWAGKSIIIYKPGEPSVYAIYGVNSVVQDGWYYLIDLTFVDGRTGIIEENESVTFDLFSATVTVSTVTATYPLYSTGGTTPDIYLDETKNAEWDLAFNETITSASVTGTTTKTLTLNQQDGGTVTASWSDDNTGLTSVGVSMPSAFSVANSPLTANGTIAITGAGTISEYIRGDGSLAAFPALTGYVPYTGATTNVDLGEFGITSGYVGFDLTPTATPTAVGTMYWDAFYRTVSLNDGDGDTTLQIGQEERLLIHNNTGATLTDGQVVYVTGSTGELPSVSLANASSESTSAATLGVVTESIANGADGFVTVSGIVHGLNTLAYTEGDLLWLSDTAGQFTNIKPISPSHLVLIGYVIKRAGGNGSILVKIQNTQELSESSDVLISAPEIDGQGLFLQTISGVQLWRNRSISDVIGGSPITGSGTTNYVPKFTSASSIGDSNIQDDGSLITLGSNSYVNGALGVGVSPSTGFNLSVQRNFTGASISYGIASLGQIQSDVATARYFYSAPSQASGASTGSVQHFFATQGTFLGTVTSQIGFYVNSTLTGATNNYGFRADLAAATNVWNIYIPGTANNYLAGSLGIGTTSLTGYNLRVSKNITGASNSYGIIQDSTIQSDVTNAYINTSNPSIAASATIGSLYHYRAFLPSIGVGSTVTAQYGFSVQSSMTGASANYGFWGGLNSASGVWNIYMSGSANNYLSGNLLIGSATDNSYKLQVTGDVDISKNDRANGAVLRLTNSFNGSGWIAGDIIGSLIFYSSDSSAAANRGAIRSISEAGSTNSSVTGLSFETFSSSLLSQKMYLSGEGSVGIGATSLTGYSLRVSKNITGAVSSNGVFVDGTIQSDATTAAIGYGTLLTTQAASFTLGSLYHFRAQQTTLGAGSTVNLQVGFDVANTLTGATQNIAFRSLLNAGTNVWNLYMNGTASNYLAGSLGIGNTSVAVFNLRVDKNVTGGTTAYGGYFGGNIQSDVTTQMFGVMSSYGTQATTFTLSNLYNFHVVQGTFGAGSTVTNQHGFSVASSLIGATNNYGFRGQIASGTGRWNLYMDGTAANYMAGQVAIGSTTLSASAALQVTSTTQGFLPPRMTAAQRAAITTPAEGLVVVQTDGTQGLYLYIGAAWHALTML